MTLNELFTSYNQVFPVEFETDNQNIYSNLDRAKSASNDYHNWKVGQHSSDVNYKHWKVKEIDLNSTDFNDNNYFNEMLQKKINTLDEAKVNFWFNKFQKLGFSKDQSIAIIVSMNEECALNPKGAVNRLEFEGKGNTESGWAGAGEGTISITHWNTKKRLITLFNKDPRREGSKLPETKSEYAKNDSRHICDLSDNDAALITAIYYNNLKNKTNLNFNDTIAEFYLDKAGRGGSAEKTQGSPYDKAVARAKDYQKVHYEQGHINSSKLNKFLMSLRLAEHIRDKIIK